MVHISHTPQPLIHARELKEDIKYKIYGGPNQNPREKPKIQSSLKPVSYTWPAAKIYLHKIKVGGETHHQQKPVLLTPKLVNLSSQSVALSKNVRWTKIMLEAK